MMRVKYPFSPPHAKRGPVIMAHLQWASASSVQVRVRAAAVPCVNTIWGQIRDPLPQSGILGQAGYSDRHCGRRLKNDSREIMGNIDAAVSSVIGALVLLHILQVNVKVYYAMACILAVVSQIVVCSGIRLAFTLVKEDRSAANLPLYKLTNLRNLN